ncbi:unnamed protein product [Amoebophrya sp. A120]|nr:unnamed protein product [Amoebophrya sp. A120]|eukprot:GSA120T00025409001.1
MPNSQNIGAATTMSRKQSTLLYYKQFGLLTTIAATTDLVVLGGREFFDCFRISGSGFLKREGAILGGDFLGKTVSAALSKTRDSCLCSCVLHCKYFEGRTSHVLLGLQSGGFLEVWLENGQEAVGTTAVGESKVEFSFWSSAPATADDPDVNQGAPIVAVQAVEMMKPKNSCCVLTLDATGSIYCWHPQRAEAFLLVSGQAWIPSVLTEFREELSSNVQTARTSALQLTSGSGSSSSNAPTSSATRPASRAAIFLPKNSAEPIVSAPAATTAASATTAHQPQGPAAHFALDQFHFSLCPFDPKKMKQTRLRLARGLRKCLRNGKLADLLQKASQEVSQQLPEEGGDGAAMQNATAGTSADINNSKNQAESAIGATFLAPRDQQDQSAELFLAVHFTCSHTSGASANFSASVAVRQKLEGFLLASDTSGKTTSAARSGEAAASHSRATAGSFGRSGLDASRDLLLQTGQEQSISSLLSPIDNPVVVKRFGLRINNGMFTEVEQHQFGRQSSPTFLTPYRFGGLLCIEQNAVVMHSLLDVTSETSSSLVQRRFVEEEHEMQHGSIANASRTLFWIDNVMSPRAALAGTTGNYYTSPPPPIRTLAADPYTGHIAIVTGDSELRIYNSIGKCFVQCPLFDLSTEFDEEGVNYSAMSHSRSLSSGAVQPREPSFSARKNSKTRSASTPAHSTSMRNSFLFLNSKVAMRYNYYVDSTRNTHTAAAASREEDHYSRSFLLLSCGSQILCLNASRGYEVFYRWCVEDLDLVQPVATNIPSSRRRSSATTASSTTDLNLHADRAENMTNTSSQHRNYSAEFAGPGGGATEGDQEGQELLPDREYYYIHNFDLSHDFQKIRVEATELNPVLAAYSSSGDASLLKQDHSNRQEFLLAVKELDCLNEDEREFDKNFLCGTRSANPNSPPPSRPGSAASSQGSKPAPAASVLKSTKPKIQLYQTMELEEQDDAETLTTSGNTMGRRRERETDSKNNSNCSWLLDTWSSLTCTSVIPRNVLPRRTRSFRSRARLSWKLLQHDGSTLLIAENRVPIAPANSTTSSILIQRLCWNFTANREEILASQVVQVGGDASGGIRDLVFLDASNYRGLWFEHSYFQHPDRELHGAAAERNVYGEGATMSSSVLVRCGTGQVTLWNVTCSV